MPNVIIEDNGARHIPLAAPIKLVGALDLGIKLGTLFNTPLKVDASMRLRMVFVNINDYWNHTWH